MYRELNEVISFLQAEGYSVSDPWDVVAIFEQKLAKFTGSKYAVSLDSCTNGLFLCLKYFSTFKLKNLPVISIPDRTYISVPQAVLHAGYDLCFNNAQWQGSYTLNPLPIIDSATRLSKGMFEPGTYCCLSFHKKKMLSIGKGGMILTDDENAYEWFKKARYEGRHIDRLYDEDDIDMLGWNMYMPPEQAAYGIILFDQLLKNFSDGKIPDIGNSAKYKRITDFTFFEKYRGPHI